MSSSLYKFLLASTIFAMEIAGATRTIDVETLFHDGKGGDYDQTYINHFANMPLKGVKETDGSVKYTTEGDGKPYVFSDPVTYVFSDSGDKCVETIVGSDDGSSFHDEFSFHGEGNICYYQLDAKINEKIQFSFEKTELTESSVIQKISVFERIQKIKYDIKNGDREITGLTNSKNADMDTIRYLKSDENDGDKIVYTSEINNSLYVLFHRTNVDAGTKFSYKLEYQSDQSADLKACTENVQERCVVRNETEEKKLIDFTKYNKQLWANNEFTNYLQIYSKK